MWLVADSANIAVGKQRLKPEGIWYTTNSGIWQTVWLEPVRGPIPLLHILPISSHAHHHISLLLIMQACAEADTLTLQLALHKCWHTWHLLHVRGHTRTHCLFDDRTTALAGAQCSHLQARPHPRHRSGTVEDQRPGQPVSLRRSVPGQLYSCKTRLSHTEANFVMPYNMPCQQLQ